jgi:hypothetical protein
MASDISLRVQPWPPAPAPTFGRLVASEALTYRALIAYIRSLGYFPDEFPDQRKSGLVIHNDKLYIVLRNKHTTFAVYRVRYDDVLRRLRRWPKAIEK